LTTTLTRDDPELIALEAAYAALDLPFRHSLWGPWVEHIKTDGMNTFRGEGFYLAQVSLGMTPERYHNTYDYLSSIGEGVALNRLGEDGAFGCEVVEWDGALVSRDLLDSVREIKFIRETLDLMQYTGLGVLDIGAGYGRLAHRIGQMFPGALTWCVDAVPLSTYLCKNYLEFRGIKMAATVPLHELHKEPFGADLACNIHSFSEQPLASVNYWLDLCAEMNIPYFFLCPHSQDFCHASFHTTEVDNNHLDYYPLFAAHGYKEIKREFKYPPELADKLVFGTEYLMFSREA
jgi:hypothetical protein